MKNLVKKSDWVSLTPKTKLGNLRIEINGNLWEVREVEEDKMLLKSANRTFGPKNKKTYDGMWIWLEDDPNFEWS